MKKAIKALNESIERQEINKDEINLHKPNLEGKGQKESKNTKLECK